MKRKITTYNYLWMAVVFLILGKIFSAWFVSPEIIGGDWPTYSLEFLHEQRIFPSLWSTYRGLGGAVTPLLNLETFQAFLVVPWVNWLGLPWSLVYKVGWFGLFVILSFLSPIVLWHSIFPRVSSWWPAFLAGLIYSTNTYILMVTGGGQMGVALAYAVAPLVLASFVKLYESIYISFSVVIPAKAGIQSGSPIGSGMTERAIIAGLALGFQLMIDPRIAYVTMIAVGFYYMVEKARLPQYYLWSAIILGSSLVLAALLNAFWLLPTMATASRTVSELGAIYTSSSAVPFFSFADFSHALSLLHPNWPENVFGKTYFLQPEFLVLPILAYASLLFLKKAKSRREIIFFCLLGLLGAFLAKGANEPFGGVYLWLFEHVPGFVMFRDPTKWYVLIAISYSILIPYTLARLGKTVLMAVFILFWLFTIRQAALGQLGGTFAKRNVPKEYVELANFIARQPEFFRTLWVPKQPRFSPVSDLHPSFFSEYITSASTAAGFVERFDTPDTQGRLEELAVKYVVIPYDALGEIFLDDRQYDPKQRQEWERYLDTVSWLKKLSSGSITVYETQRHDDHFWVTTGKVLGYRARSPDRYDVSFTSETPTVLYFSEGFNPGWRLSIGNQTIESSKTPSGLNSFVIPGGFTGETQVFFYPEVFAKWGRVVSIATLAGVAVFVILQSQRRKRSL